MPLLRCAMRVSCAWGRIGTFCRLVGQSGLCMRTVLYVYSSAAFSVCFWFSSLSALYFLFPLLLFSLTS